MLDSVRSSSLIAVMTLVAGCGFERPEDVPETFVIGGTVGGMWDGAAIGLRLEAADVGDLANVTANGTFEFSTSVEEGMSYTVTIETPPAAHDCEVVQGLGTATADVDDIEVDCDGPVVDIAISAPVAWTFDPGITSYDLDASVVVQMTSLTVTADDATAIVWNEVSLTSGAPSPEVALGLGANEQTVLVEVGSASRSYRIGINRGGAIAEQYTYGKASNAEMDDGFGWSVAASGDTIAVGARHEDSPSTGVNGKETSNTRLASGAVYVFRRNGIEWTQEAYIKASNTDANDNFGDSVALSGDVLVVGTPGEASIATGVGGNQLDNTAASAGAAYVFRRSGTTWAQEAYVKASNTAAGDAFGGEVAASGDTIAVSAISEDSATIGTGGGGQTDNSALGSGAVYVFRWNGTSWSQQAYIKPSNTGQGDQFGWDLDLESDTLVVSSLMEASAATGINGNAQDNSSSAAGAVYVFRRAGTTWSQEAYVKASNTNASDFFGASVALSGDLLAVGAFGEASNAAGIGGNQLDNSLAGSGAAYVFRRTGSTWAQESYVKASTPGENDLFGSFVDLFGDVLLVGAYEEDSASVGVNGSESSNAAPASGAAYLFHHDGTSWQQNGYLKASNTDSGDAFARHAAVTNAGVIVCASGEASGASQIDGDQTDDSAPGAGAIYIFR